MVYLQTLCLILLYGEKLHKPRALPASPQLQPQTAHSSLSLCFSTYCSLCLAFALGLTSIKELLFILYHSIQILGLLITMFMECFSPSHGLFPYCLFKMYIENGLIWKAYLANLLLPTKENVTRSVKIKI